MRELIITGLLMMLTMPVWANTAKEDVIKRLESYNALKASFTQTTVDARGNTGAHSTGNMALKRPNHFRWEVKKPYSQLMMANGQTLWIYDKSLDQVTIKQLNPRNKSNPAMLLSGHVKRYIDQFSVVRIDASPGINGSKEDQYMAFRLEPKQDNAMIRSVTLFFMKGELSKMRVVDQFGQRTIYRFHNVQVNPKLKNDLFHFKTPKGVDVIDNRDAN